MRNPSAGVGARQQHGDDGEAGLPPLPVERQVPLPLLPWTDTVDAEENGHGVTGCEGALQRLRPRLPGGEIPAVEEDAQAALSQRTRNRLHRSVVAPVIAEEDVE